MTEKEQVMLKQEVVDLQLGQDILKQELRDAAKQMEAALMLSQETMEELKFTKKSLQLLSNDLFTLEGKLELHIPSLNQLNCRKCGKRLTQQADNCPFCHVANPAGI